MKKLNALALSAVLATTYTFGMGSALAADQNAPDKDDQAQSQQETHDAASAEKGKRQNPSSLDSNSTRNARSEDDMAAAEGEEGSDEDMSWKQDEESSEYGMSADAEGAEPAFHANDLIGETVTNRSNDAKIGSISDLVLSEDGQVVSVIVGVGGFLGIGKKDVAISWDEVERSQSTDSEDYVLSVDKDEQWLKDAEDHDREFGQSASDQQSE